MTVGERSRPPLDSCVEIVNIRNDQMHSEEAHKAERKSLPLETVLHLSPVLPCLGHEKPAPVVSLSKSTGDTERLRVGDMLCEVQTLSFDFLSVCVLPRYAFDHF